CSICFRSATITDNSLKYCLLLTKLLDQRFLTKQRSSCTSFNQAITCWSKTSA
ncbi:hypothetical protein ATANTOWER_024719, partial [Ataeniobius toweri]|nr:hypothetical protein [Ataeniobius toweri]